MTEPNIEEAIRVLRRANSMIQMKDQPGWALVQQYIRMALKALTGRPVP